jgi:hypothetical protein
VWRITDPAERLLLAWSYDERSNGPIDESAGVFQKARTLRSWKLPVADEDFPTPSGWPTSARRI